MLLVQGVITEGLLLTWVSKDFQPVYILRGHVWSCPSDRLWTGPVLVAVSRGNNESGLDCRASV